ncbi:hypothetical protein RFI_19404, partial [Reticulomyxa filosa]
YIYIYIYVCVFDGKITEMYGEEVYMPLLKQIAEVLYAALLKIDDKAMFFHVGRNQFYILKVISWRQSSAEFLTPLLDAMRKCRIPLTYKEKEPPNRSANNAHNVEVRRTVSIGLCLWNYGESVEHARTKAKEALDFCKKHGGNQSFLYNKEAIDAADKGWMDTNKRTNLWSKQMYDLVSCYGKEYGSACKQMMKSLTNKGASVNWQNPLDGNNTIIMHCIENEYLQILSELLTWKEWNPDLTRNDGSNALLVALQNHLPQPMIVQIAKRTKDKNVTNSVCFILSFFFSLLSSSLVTTLFCVGVIAVIPHLFHLQFFPFFLLFVISEVCFCLLCLALFCFEVACAYADIVNLHCNKSLMRIKKKISFSLCVDQMRKNKLSKNLHPNLIFKTNHYLQKNQKNLKKIKIKKKNNDNDNFFFYLPQCLLIYFKIWIIHIKPERKKNYRKILY